jgi:hypothetical protein
MDAAGGGRISTHHICIEETILPPSVERLCRAHAFDPGLTKCLGVKPKVVQLPNVFLKPL